MTLLPGTIRMRPRLVFDWSHGDRPFFPHGPRMCDSGTVQGRRYSTVLRCEANRMSVTEAEGVVVDETRKALLTPFGPFLALRPGRLGNDI